MIRSVVEQSAVEAAFLWSSRSAAVHDPHFDLPDLEKLDERLEAQLDCLRLAGDTGWEICKAAVDEDPGEVFAASAIAVYRFDLRGIADILDLCDGAPPLQRAVASALGWISLDHTSQIFPGLLDSECPPVLHTLGIAASAAHGVHPGPVLSQALYSNNAELQIGAFKAVGQLGRVELAAEIQAFLISPHAAANAEAHFAAARSLALLGRHDAASPILWTIAKAANPFSEGAAALAARCEAPGRAQTNLRSLLAASATRRAAIVGIGASGDTLLVPSLLSEMEDPALRRIAAEAFTMITGMSVAEGPLRGQPPPDFQSGPTEDPDDDNVAMDPDYYLPWPDVRAVAAWWTKYRTRYSAGVKYLAGRPIDAAWAGEVLRRGLQRQRAAAAVELALLSPGKPLFDVTAPAFRQRAALQGRKSQ
ncbi:MAG: TIGR02270 family protein [Polyangiaceae bacterium]|nr:TIGR02270 family protein [Polyangiaceae bacterium]